ncbi:MAG: helix-turn-helix domain-containing protein [Dysgonamonadaceae bacterium]|jgi:transcriptional regulator with XRE-family HTH domain|nr:helix-turn-helix domain-containing protein [Dysgonamonadaceae bacterium]
MDDEKDPVVDPVRIRKIMEEKGLNSASFADKIDVSRGTITHILNGRNEITLNVVLKILRAFPDINSEWLLFGKDPMYHREKLFIRSEKEPTLPFDDTTGIFNPQKNEINAHKEPKVSEYPLKSEDKTAVEAEQLIKAKQISDIISSNRRIDKIIILYNDKTFMSFSPEE